jgi:hypothetical protein
MAKAFANEFGLRGRNVLGEQTWDPKASSYVELFNQIKATSPDCLNLGSSTLEATTDDYAVQLIKDKFATLGDNTAVKLLAGDWVPTPTNALTEAQGMYGTLSGLSIDDLTNDGKAGGQFISAYRSKYGAAPPST